MYFYLVDDFVSQHRYEAVLHRLEAKFTELGIQGRMSKLTVLKNAGELVRDAVKHGADTVVAIGDDGTVSKMISAVVEQKVPFGIIPVGPNQTIAKALGMPDGDAACEVISRRVLDEVDLGKVGERYFLRSLEVPESLYQLDCDGQYKVSVTTPEPLSVRNFGPNGHDPKDGVLEAVVGGAETKGFALFRRNDNRPSIFPVHTLTITAPEPINLLLDGQTVVKTPATVEASKKRLKVIVGKDREF